MKTTEDILNHAGVKGMRWGVRKSNSRKGLLVTKTKPTGDSRKGLLVTKRKLEGDSRKGLLVTKTKPKSSKREIQALLKTDAKQKPSTGGVGLALALQGTPLAAPVAAGVAIQSFKQGRARKRKIAKALGGRPTDFKRKDLNNASGLVKRYEGVKLVSDGKSVKMATNLDEVLLHAGVKGMKWGVLRSASAKAAAKAKSGGKVVAGKAKDNVVVNRVKEEVKSSKREASWGKVKIDGMSTQEITQVARRASMENELKRMSKNKDVRGKTTKADYRKRESMSDQELMETVTRLRAKESFVRSRDAATKSQRELGKKVIDAAGPLAVKYALTGKVGPKDVITAVQTLQKKSDGAIKPGELKNEIGKAVMGNVVKVKQGEIYGKMGLNPDGTLKES